MIFGDRWRREAAGTLLHQAFDTLKRQHQAKRMRQTVTDLFIALLRQFGPRHKPRCKPTTITRRQLLIDQVPGS